MKLRNKLLTASLLSAMTLGAQADVSGYVTVTSDYMFRGVTLNDKSPALQGGIDWEGDTGWYAGGWASQTDDGETSDVEVDLFAGYYGEMENGFEYDLMVIYYALLDDADYNYFELHGALIRPVSDSLTLSLNLDYTNDSIAAKGFGDDLSALHVSAIAEYDLGDDMGLAFEYGRQGWDEDGENYGYNWGRVSLTKDYNDFSFDLSAWYNNLDDDDSSKFTASVSYNF
ncbi:TorF family putative porin [Lacimicrobium sp. SS2-24]|uniref:TorF family putative porin n=1 Tax=Lacimicrobium sp. SS2-24 TaxID=2005569 RepID=UPI000B4A8D3A|nr:TorF family putative porin [Lacimicrobium sp. SS2-24]